MTLYLDPIPPGQPASFAERAKRVCTGASTSIEGRLSRIRNIVQSAGGLAALDAQLGADAAAHAAAYAALKAAALAVNPDATIPDLV